MADSILHAIDMTQIEKILDNEQQVQMDLKKEREEKEELKRHLELTTTQLDNLMEKHQMLQTKSHDQAFELQLLRKGLEDAAQEYSNLEGEVARLKEGEAKAAQATATAVDFIHRGKPLLAGLQIDVSQTAQALSRLIVQHEEAVNMGVIPDRNKSESALARFETELRAVELRANLATGAQYDQRARISNLEEQLARKDQQLQECTDEHISRVMALEATIESLNIQHEAALQAAREAIAAAEVDKNLVMTMSHAMDTLTGLQQANQLL